MAIVIGLCAALPQLAAMVRARSAAGQSSLGWSLGAFVNGLMSYVNFAGYHATVLAVGNVASLMICVVAVGLVARFGPGAHAHAHPHAAPVVHLPGVHVGELPTSEFWALREQLEHEARRRDELGLVAA
ncbi:MAG: hypothetical protein JWQ20_4036 [Conexibacter sp.]|jgi:hypothetical protein|nr:hypothetical protein [Conexibacter sp.]